VTDDLRDLSGRVARLFAALLIGVLTAIMFVFGFAQLITDQKTGATGWFAIFSFVMVLVLTTIGVNALLAHIAPSPQRRSPLPIARVVRR
jgi:hypothetical protein